MTKGFRFPKSFELGGQTINVHLKDSMGKIDAHGLARYDEGEIWFDNNIKPNDLKAITYYHELMHFILNTLGREELRNDESFVDSVGNLLWQAHKTARY